MHSGWGGGGKVWLGLPDAQRNFYAHAGTQTHARTGPFKTFQGIPVEILPPSGQKRKKSCPQHWKKIKNNNSLFILEKKHVTITFNRVPGRRDKETTELN